MTSILIKNAFLDNGLTDALIAGGKFAKIAPSIDCAADNVIDAKARMALTPAFYNAHTHAAMTLLRGYADDMELFTWLNDHIWPAEARLAPEDIYHGTRLAILEMIHSGTVFFNDMYWHPQESIRAAQEMGVRAAIGTLYITGENGEVLPRNRMCNEELISQRDNYGELIQIALAPHSIYSVSHKILREIAHDSREYGMPVHIHASETAKEVSDCRIANNGKTPIECLHGLGLLGPRTILAHCVELTDNDIRLVEATGSVIAHCPCSNMKLCSGMFRFHDAVDIGGCRLAIGTDGCASNNNLSMLEEMKFAALSAKIQSGQPTAAKDSTVFMAGTRSSALAFGIDAGEIAVGRLADALLVKLDAPTMVGDYNLTANLVYSANPSVIDTVICNGEILMQNSIIPNEMDIINKARQACRKLRRRI